MSDRPRVLVIGSGLAGLAAAYELSERGLSVTVVEAARYPGGRTTSWVDDDGRVLDTGAHVMADHYVNLRDVLSRIGAANRLAWFRNQLFLRRGSPPVEWRLAQAPPPMHMLRVASRLRMNPWLYFKLALAALDLTSYPESRLSRLDAISYAEWQRRRLGENFMEIGDAAAEAACFLPANQASAYAVSSWIRAMARSGEASDIASFDGPFHEVLIGPLLRAIELQGGRLLLNTAVVRIEHDNSRAIAALTRTTSCTGPFHRADGKPPLRMDQPEQRIECDYVISAIPVQSFKAVATDQLLRAAGLTGVKSLVTVPAIGVTIWFDRSLPPAPRCTPLCSGLAMRGFMDFASIRRAEPEDPATLQFVLSKAPERMQQSDEEILHQVVADFRAVWPPALEARVNDYAIERVGAAMHASIPGAYEKRPPAATRLRNLYLAGDWVKHDVKPSMEGAVVAGRYAANGVLKSLGRREVSVLTPPEGVFTAAARRVRALVP